MNDYMSGRGLTGPTVDLGAQLEWIRESILSSVLNDRCKLQLL